MSSLETHIRQLAADGVRIHIWPTKGGQFQANVGEQGLGEGWTCHTAPDPIEALSVALRLRATAAHGRDVVFDPVAPVQIDLEEAIEASGKGDLGPTGFDADGFCLVCESGGSGCAACRATGDTDDFEELL